MWVEIEIEIEIIITTIFHKWVLYYNVNHQVLFPPIKMLFNSTE